MMSTRVPASSSDVSPAARLSSRASSRLPGAARARVGTRRQRGGPVGTRAIFGGIFDGGGSKRREAAKAALLEAIEGTQRGIAASEDDVAAVEAAASALERLNPNRHPLASPL